MKAMTQSAARNKADNIGDAKAYRQACAIVERQFRKLNEVCPGIESAHLVQAGETMFMWGLFSEMTGDDARSRKLLAKYLREYAKMDSELSECHAELTASAAKWNDLVKEVSDRGRQAYTKNDDDHLGRIALFLLEHMGIGQADEPPTSH